MTFEMTISSGQPQDIRDANRTGNTDARNLAEDAPCTLDYQRLDDTYFSDVCPCAHARHSHGLGGCWVSGCDCDVPYLLIPGRAA